MKRLSAAGKQALKEALCSIYWYKSDLQSFLNSVISDKTIIAKVDWTNYKRQIASDVVDVLHQDQDKYLADLTKLASEVCEFKTFKHLESLTDGDEKAKKAKLAVEQLADMLRSHEDAKKEAEAIEDRRKQYQEKLARSNAIQEKLADINKAYFSLVTDSNPQNRGFKLEKVLKELFDLFDLDPKASFKVAGEQIDGAFALEGTEYLFEAKWTSDLVPAEQLDSFSSKVKRKLDNTLGLFLSINGFSKDAVDLHSQGRPVIILMTGADLMAVLETRIDFTSLLLRKKKHASQTGQILLQIHEMY